MKKSICTYNRIRHDSKGFSLVEVIVALAILAIFGTSLYAGFRSSAQLNNRAFYTQEATTHAQRAMESLRSIRFTDVTNQAAIEEDLQEIFGADIGLIDADSDDALMGIHAGVEGSGAHMFTSLTFRQPDIRIGTRDYAMEIILDPIPYSIGANPFADDSNIHELPRLEMIDGMRFPVIGSELEQAERWIDAPNHYSVVADLVLEAAGLGVTMLPTQVFDVLEKTTYITITGNNNEIRVVADLIYTLQTPPATGSLPLEKAYTVYNSRFSLDFDSDSGSWTQGGRIYLFAKAFFDYANTLYGSGHFNIKHNELVIDQRGYTGTRCLEVVLVRGYHTSGDVSFGYNFDTIRVIYAPDGSFDYYYNALPVNNMIGEQVFGDPNSHHLRLYTNIKGNLDVRSSDFTAVPAHMNTSIGVDRARLVNYEVTIRMLHIDGALENNAATITTTMRIRE